MAPEKEGGGLEGDDICVSSCRDFLCERRELCLLESGVPG